jgi:hypothetical protein
MQKVVVKAARRVALFYIVPGARQISALGDAWGNQIATSSDQLVQIWQKPRQCLDSGISARNAGRASLWSYGNPSLSERCESPPLHATNCTLSVQ